MLRCRHSQPDPEDAKGKESNIHSNKNDSAFRQPFLTLSSGVRYSFRIAGIQVKGAYKVYWESTFSKAAEYADPDETYTSLGDDS